MQHSIPLCLENLLYNPAYNQKLIKFSIWNLNVKLILAIEEGILQDNTIGKGKVNFLVLKVEMTG